LSPSQDGLGTQREPGERGRPIAIGEKPLGETEDRKRLESFSEPTFYPVGVAKACSKRKGRCACGKRWREKSLRGVKEEGTGRRGKRGEI